MSVISPRVARLVKPPEFGIQPVMLSGGRLALEPTYDIRLRIGGHQAGTDWRPLVVTGTTPATEGVDVIIGMDLILKIQGGWNGPAGTAFLAD